MLPIAGKVLFPPLSSQIARTCQSNHRPCEEQDLTSGRITAFMSVLADVWLPMQKLHSSSFYCSILSTGILCPSMSNFAAHDKIWGNYFLPYKTNAQHKALPLSSSPFLQQNTNLPSSFFLSVLQHEFLHNLSLSDILYRCTIPFILIWTLYHVFKCNTENQTQTKAADAGLPSSRLYVLHKTLASFTVPHYLFTSIQLIISTLLLLFGSYPQPVV